jgi:hypothetical protein
MLLETSGGPLTLAITSYTSTWRHILATLISTSTLDGVVSPHPQVCASRIAQGKPFFGLLTISPDSLALQL